MLLLFPALIATVLVLGAGLTLAAAGASMALASGSTILLIALAATLAIAALQLLWTLRWPFLVFGVLVPIGIGGLILTCLIWGVLTRDQHVWQLRDASAQHRAIVLTDPSGTEIGTLSLGLIAGTGQQPGYLARDITAEAVPAIWWTCAVWWEDRGLRAAWHVGGVDLLGVLRGYRATFTSRREGGSTLSEMIGRELLELRPHPSAPLWEELPRKLTAWSYGPAVHALFPDEPQLARAAATYLPLVIGARGSRFGPELHGLTLASAMVFGKSPDQLDAAEAALLAAAIKLPVVMAPADSASGTAAAERRFTYLRARADRCLANAPMPQGIDRDEARSRIQRLPVPVLDRAARLSAAPAAMLAVPAVLTREVGPDWHGRVASVQVPRMPTGFQNTFAAAVHEIERRADGLEVPMWDGPNHALVLGAVADADGRLILEIGNAGASLAAAGPQPIASLGKIAAAIVLGHHDRPGSVYRDPAGHTLTALDAFAQSAGPPILARLAQHPEAEAQAAFAALGWPAPPAGSARYNATDGTLEVRPDQVLRAAIALTSVLSGHPAPARLPTSVTRIVLTDGRLLSPVQPALPIEPLLAQLDPMARTFVARVLGAPITRGTLRKLATVAAAPGVSDTWGKTGTGNAADGRRTRVMWQVGGLVYRGHPLSFLLLVAGTNRHPLGHVGSSTLTPLTELLLRTAFRISEERR